MPVEFRILPDRGLVVVRFTGTVMIDEALEATRQYVSHADYAPGQKQLVDLSHATGFERDYVRFMEMQAAKADRLACAGVQSLVVYIAPTPISQEICTMYLRSWDDVDSVVPMVQHSEAQALTLLGQPEATVDMLLAPQGGRALQ
ncbi:hypothetical protein [uncultured Tateyamaria sp.]|uniref:hypothetical protein n=1 Tax=uncultured Tateyamaria sp. TaxID=455651 RepID=UPI002636BDD9|nr:hypothetical protein [uncultured Tateyamaria sp.]